MNEKIKRALEALAAACEKRDAAYNKLEEAGDDIAAEDLSELNKTFDDAQADVERCKSEHERLVRVKEARDASPLPELPAAEEKPELRHARPAGSSTEEPTYRPDQMAERSFFGDILARKNGNGDAGERLARNREEALDAYKASVGIDYRDMSNGSTTGGDFVPTVYLNDLWVGPNIARRPFADAVPKYPLPPTGTTLSLPQLSSGVSVAGRSDAGSVSETDGVTASITHDVNEIAGQVDIGRIVVSRSEPGLDQVIGQTLVRRYHSYLDTQLFAGSGTAPQHRGLRNVSGKNATTYTASTPTGSALLSKIYGAIADISTNRIENDADMIVMHSRRADWLASSTSSSVPLFQQGALFQAFGSQDGGFVESFAGLRVVRDNNIATNYGTGTNEDEIYVLASTDLYLSEGPLMSRVFEDVGSGSGLIRYQIFASSAWLSKRYPSSISVISGSVLAAPTF